MRAGIDLGGTKIEGIVLSDDGTEQARKRIDAPRGDYSKTLAAINGLVDELEAQSSKSISHVGVGIPGTISPTTGLVKNANSAWLIGHPLDHDLANILARPVRLENDANCFAISEAADGAATGARVAFGVILGTGVGGGIVVNGAPLTGPNAIAGEWGHNPIPWPEDIERPGPACYCGLKGCIETFLSGPALARDYASFSGRDLPAIKIAQLAKGGDREANAALIRYEGRLARALATVINFIDPDIIVLGGGLSNLDRLYDRVPLLLPQWVFSDTVTTKIVKNHHGDSSGVRGAAWLWRADEIGEQASA